MAVPQAAAATSEFSKNSEACLFATAKFPQIFAKKAQIPLKKGPVLKQFQPSPVFHAFSPCVSHFSPFPPPLPFHPNVLTNRHKMPKDGPKNQFFFFFTH